MKPYSLQNVNSLYDDDSLHIIKGYIKISFFLGSALSGLSDVGDRYSRSLSLLYHMENLQTSPYAKTILQYFSAKIGAFVQCSFNRRFYLNVSCNTLKFSPLSKLSRYAIFLYFIIANYVPFIFVFYATLDSHTSCSIHYFNH